MAPLTQKEIMKRSLHELDPAAALLRKPIPWGGLRYVAEGLKGPKTRWLRLGPLPVGETQLHPMVEAGQRMFQLTMAAERTALFNAAMNKGMTSGQAYNLVKQTFFDYAALTPIERRFLQPTMMFYGWLRSSIAYLLPRVTLQWPSRVSQFTRGLSRLSAQQDEAMPPWLKDTMAVPLPLGKTADGKTRVIRSFGLPLEDLALFGPSVHATLLKVIARTNPLIKGLYTAASGKDPFTDRRVAEQPFGLWRTAYETFIPQHLLLKNVSKLFDYDPQSPTPGWGQALWNALSATTRIQTGEYNLKMQSLRALQNEMRKELEGMKNVRLFETPYYPKGLGEAPEETAQKMEQYRTLGTLIGMYGGIPRQMEAPTQPAGRPISTLIGD
jgi:hypothetical protein